MYPPLRLDPPIWLETPGGQALAHFLVDRGIEFDLEWICFHSDGSIYSWMNYDVRAAKNLTIGRESILPVERRSQMPSKSAKQRRFMSAAAHSKSFAKRAGVPQSVAREFHQADRGKKYGAGGKRGKRK